MADLIIIINLDESRKKHGLIIETYEGIIPHLKSKQFSGPLRNVNLSSSSKFDNLSPAELQLIKDVIVSPFNTQINKYQHICSVECLSKINSLVATHSFFSKDKHLVYEIEALYLNSDNKGLECIHDFSALQIKTSLYINYDITKAEIPYYGMIASFYIDIFSPRYHAELFFDYGSDIVIANSKELILSNGKKYRNYRLELETINKINSCNWKSHEKNFFIYDGKDISKDLLKLEKLGVHLFTNDRKKINAVDFSTVNIDYGVDWFEIRGDVKAGDLEFAVSELVDFRNRRTNWTEYKGQVLFLPAELKKLANNQIEKSGKTLRFSSSDILETLVIVNNLSKNNIHDSLLLSKYEDITLKLPGNLHSILRNYQNTGVKWLLSLRRNGLGGCLADDMGLGKTIQIIAYLSDESQKNTKALIVVPKTLLENWRREFDKFSPNISYYVYHGIERNIDFAHNNRVIITTYGTLLNDVELFSKLRFDHLVIDEAQNIKNSKTKAYRAIARIVASTRIVLTGTPLENNIQEYWALMKIANPTKLSLKSISAGLEDNQNVVEKIKELTHPFLLRRLKNDVLIDLPEKQEQIVYCNFDEAQKQLYENVLESIKQEIIRIPDKHEIKSNSIVLNGLLYLQEICCHPRLLPKEYNLSRCVESAKTEQLVSMLKELYYSDHKVVVFSRFTRMLEIINRELSNLHFNVFYLDGNTNNRQKVVDEFETSFSGIFLVSLKAGGVGLNLVSADSVVIYDPWWNPAVEKQAEDRIYRIGQKRKVTVYKLIAANTIEEKIQILQKTKLKLFNDIIEGHDIPQNISMKDIRNLIDG